MNTELMESPQSQRSDGVLANAQASRQMAEVQSAMVIAKKFPRDETAAISRITQACQRLRLAEAAMYSYPRGGQRITGPSIRLAEAIAQAWGNLDYGIVELEQRDGESVVMSYCVDLETNTRQTKVFTVKHERSRQAGNVRLNDPRDIYELTANQGARRLRACILGIIPGDVIDLAVEKCEETLKGGNGEPLIDRIRKMVLAFEKLGISKEMIENRLLHKIEATDGSEFVGLRQIYQSLKDGMSKREDWFKVKQDAEVAKSDLNQSLKEPSQPAAFDYQQFEALLQSCKSKKSCDELLSKSLDGISDQATEARLVELVEARKEALSK